MTSHDQGHRGACLRDLVLCTCPLDGVARVLEGKERFPSGALSHVPLALTGVQEARQALVRVLVASPDGGIGAAELCAPAGTSRAAGLWRRWGWDVLVTAAVVCVREGIAELPDP